MDDFPNYASCTYGINWNRLYSICGVRESEHGRIKKKENN